VQLIQQPESRARLLARGALGALRRGAWHGAFVFFRLSSPCVVLSVSQAHHFAGVLSVSRISNTVHLAGVGLV